MNVFSLEVLREEGSNDEVELRLTFLTAVRRCLTLKEFIGGGMINDHARKGIDRPPRREPRSDVTSWTCLAKNQGSWHI